MAQTKAGYLVRVEQAIQYSDYLLAIVCSRKQTRFGPELAIWLE